jgi:hypothetical protein
MKEYARIPEPRETFLLGHLLALGADTPVQDMVKLARELGPIYRFDKLGFETEALLADFVMDRQGRTHDLIVMSYDVTGLNE